MRLFGNALHFALSGKPVSLTFGDASEYLVFALMKGAARWSLALNLRDISQS